MNSDQKDQKNVIECQYSPKIQNPSSKRSMNLVECPQCHQWKGKLYLRKHLRVIHNKKRGVPKNPFTCANCHKILNSKAKAKHLRLCESKLKVQKEIKKQESKSHIQSVLNTPQNTRTPQIEAEIIKKFTTIKKKTKYIERVERLFRPNYTFQSKKKKCQPQTLIYFEESSESITCKVRQIKKGIQNKQLKQKQKEIKNKNQEQEEQDYLNAILCQESHQFQPSHYF